MVMQPYYLSKFPLGRSVVQHLVCITGGGHFKISLFGSSRRVCRLKKKSSINSMRHEHLGLLTITKYI